MSRKDERSSLNQVCTAEVLTLSPKVSGYLFALTSFLVRNEKGKKNYQKLVASARDGGEIDEQAILKIYGYDTSADFEKAWYEWIESNEFR